MFVAAQDLEVNICRGVFTHFRRKEDVYLKSGKFDEELRRMSQITDHLMQGALILFNESFAATNEREGAEIAHQVVEALMEKEIKVFFVTHMYAFSSYFNEGKSSECLFLRAERGDNAQRTYKITKGVPLPSSYGADLYQRIFGDSS
ncbi:hypothetical protein GCM10023231_13620 [Olivibacter ginsenosidimutans]|uniref:DNA mismatch repair proteins mutS family domain-containing protein n=1 Tax=Olivibacter ginsenosidimutans TaxID=1176537 RepID=A0ABP9AVF6_9SPHI